MNGVRSEAQVLIEDWRHDYNHHRPHSALGMMTPSAFGVGYRSGDLLIMDLTATRKFGPWEIGPVAVTKWQTTYDRPGARASCATMAAATFSALTCGRANHLAIGGLVGYDFGPLALKLIAAQSVYATDDIRGLSVWTRATFRLWAP